VGITGHGYTNYPEKEACLAFFSDDGILNDD